MPLGDGTGPAWSGNEQIGNGKNAAERQNGFGRCNGRGNGARQGGRRRKNFASNGYGSLVENQSQKIEALCHELTALKAKFSERSKQNDAAENDN